MPFTLSHPAIVLPFLRWKRVSVTGLVIGSMIPDFEYFLRLRVYGIYGHTWDGLFWFDLPLALLMAYLFHYLMGPVLMNNLPGFMQRRFPGMIGSQWHAYVRTYPLIVILSILFGAAGHILWDSFTHNNTYISTHWLILQRQVDLGFQDYPLWHILQQVSTVVGLIFILLYFRKLPADGVVTTNRKTWFWVVLIVIVSIISCWRLYEISNSEIVKIGHIAVITMGASVYGLLLVSLFWRKLQRPD
ncbi:DUF4184 family protein [Fulvivirga sedimenti]|uniref:DUF4184 family protein n=1 Tax=Fulvivirga sedimenti TaxID=2879465 RepID=A0A9X1HL75_9BACT|nr:DUF4184 family protein [Fulvivirga sedimenti]